MDFASNGFLRIGAPVSAILRATTSVEWNDNGNAEDVITTAGETGSTVGVRMAQVSGTFAVPKTGVELRRLTEAYEQSKTLEVYGHFGQQIKRCRGTIKSLRVSSQVNRPVEITLEISGAALTTQNA